MYTVCPYESDTRNPKKRYEWTHAHIDRSIDRSTLVDARRSDLTSLETHRRRRNERSSRRHTTLETFTTTTTYTTRCAKSSRFTLVKRACKLATRAGSCTASNTGFNRSTYAAVFFSLKDAASPTRRIACVFDGLASFATCVLLPKIAPRARELTKRES